METSSQNICYWISKLRDMDWIIFDPKITWDTGIQLTLLLIGIIVVVTQLRAQRDLQKKQHKDTIQYNVYEKLVDNYENCQPTAMSMTLNLVMAEFDKAIERTKKGHDYIPPPFYLDDIHAKYMELSTNLFRLTATMDKYQIISPHISLFRKVLDQKITELGDHFVTLIFVFAYILLPEKGQSNPIHIPNAKTIKQIKDKVLQFSNTSWDIAYYLDDILTETQNVLLGDFFSHHLPVRKPEDPKELVLTSSNPKMITLAEKKLKNSATN
ncbi:MAG: hypothetical protein GQ559_11145 [Desulfobulbaceae bacterium]|nr:hypothetical protein [Desulfobulbaceae bacterium]